VTLSNGLRIPAGATIEAAHGPTLQDPNLYPRPDQFDARRFLRLRDASEPDPLSYKNREQYQFIAVTKENLSFGFGKHACPGRFFAANEIKLILARILLNYDIRPPKGAKELKPRITQGANSQADPRLEIEFKKFKADA
jgi:cytochrome P450